MMGTASTRSITKHTMKAIHFPEPLDVALEGPQMSQGLAANRAIPHDLGLDSSSLSLQLNESVNALRKFFLEGPVCHDDGMQSRHLTHDCFTERIELRHCNSALNKHAR